MGDWEGREAQGVRQDHGPRHQDQAVPSRQEVYHQQFARDADHATQGEACRWQHVEPDESTAVGPSRPSSAARR